MAMLRVRRVQHERRPPSTLRPCRGLGGCNMRGDLPPPYGHVARVHHRLPCDEGPAGALVSQLPYPHSTCMSGLGVQSRMQSGLRVFRRLHKKTPSRSERAKSTRSTSGLVTRCVAGMTPLLISHCRACLHSNESTFMILRKSAYRWKATHWLAGYLAPRCYTMENWLALETVN